MRRLEIARRCCIAHGCCFSTKRPSGSVQARADILDHVRQLVTEQGIGVLWATHLFDEILPSDDLVVLHQGRVLAHGQVARSSPTPEPARSIPPFHAPDRSGDGVREPSAMSSSTVHHNQAGFWVAEYAICLNGIVWREALRFLHQRERFVSALVRPLVWLFIFAAGFRQVLGISISRPTRPTSFTRSTSRRRFDRNDPAVEACKRRSRWSR